jgi:hypothetical protein
MGTFGWWVIANGQCNIEEKRKEPTKVLLHRTEEGGVGAQLPTSQKDCLSSQSWRLESGGELPISCAWLAGNQLTQPRLLDKRKAALKTSL